MGGHLTNLTDTGRDWATVKRPLGLGDDLDKEAGSRQKAGGKQLGLSM